MTRGEMVAELHALGKELVNATDPNHPDAYSLGWEMTITRVLKQIASFAPEDMRAPLPRREKANG